MSDSIDPTKDPLYAAAHQAALDKALGGLNLRDWYAGIKDRVVELAPSCKYSPAQIIDVLAGTATDDDSAYLAALDPDIRAVMESMVTDAIERAVNPDPLPLSDYGLREQFKKSNGPELRYSQGWRVWSGGEWVPDQTEALVDENIVMFCKRLRVEMVRTAQVAAKEAKALESYSTLCKIRNMAQTTAGIAIFPGMWDLDEYLLGVPGGVVDLRTGEFRGRRRDELISKRTVAAPTDGTNDPYCSCQTWGWFLRWATDNDEELQRYLARVAGYTLTASYKEQCLFFFHGTGGNGKGTLLTTLSDLMGDYATVGDLRSIAQVRSGNLVHSTETAKLMGRRMVTFQETGTAGTGFQWDDAKVKSFTGGDKQTARFIAKDNSDFPPIFKFWFSSNNTPGISIVDDAWRRRLHLINFQQKYIQADTDLPEKLKHEYGGILRWAINGCLDWQNGGLRPPASVVAASKQHLDDQDVLKEWINECCLLDPTYLAEKVELFNSWKAWAKERNELGPFTSQRLLIKALEARGYKKAHMGHSGRERLQGIRVK
jgi:putative DNA primase/helicase